MKRFLLVDANDCVVFNTDDKQEAYEYQNRRRPDTRLVYTLRIWKDGLFVNYHYGSE